MTTMNLAREPELIAWWIGDEAYRWQETFLAWLSGADSPSAAPTICRVQLVGRSALSLPRLPMRGNKLAGSSSPLVIWAIPEFGIADLIHQIDHTRHTRSGYTHITAGLVSPRERMVLSEVGVAAHVQKPCDWTAFHHLFRVR